MHFAKKHWETICENTKLSRSRYSFICWQFLQCYILVYHQSVFKENTRRTYEQLSVEMGCCSVSEAISEFTIQYSRNRNECEVSNQARVINTYGLDGNKSNARGIKLRLVEHNNRVTLQRFDITEHCSITKTRHEHYQLIHNYGKLAISALN